MALSLGEVRWLAGLLEGEGSFGFFLNKDPHGIPRYPVLRISLGMTDEDVVERAAAIMRARGRRTYRQGNRKPMHETSVTGSRAAGWMMTLWPLMGVRRKTRIIECLREWNGPSRRVFQREAGKPCRRGHLDWYKAPKSGRLECRPCKAADKRRRRTEK